MDAVLFHGFEPRKRLHRGLAQTAISVDPNRLPGGLAVFAERRRVNGHDLAVVVDGILRAPLQWRPPTKNEAVRQTHLLATQSGNRNVNF